MDFWARIKRYAPWMGVVLIALFLVIGSIRVAADKREAARQNTFAAYLERGVRTAADAAPEGAAVDAEPEERGQTLYAAPSGKRYHYDPRCPGKNSTEITWDEVTARGLTPCKKCVLS